MTAETVTRCFICKRTCSADMELKKGWVKCPMHGPVKINDVVEYEEG